MQRKKHRIGIWAVIAGLIALSFSTGGCTSATPAPVIYGRAPAPILGPAPAAAGAIDFSTPPFDEITTPRIAYDQPPSECVPFARTISGLAIWGDAVTWWAQAAGKYPRSSRPPKARSWCCAAGRTTSADMWRS